MAEKWLTDWVSLACIIMTIHRKSVLTGQARGARLVARGKSRAFDWKSSPLASGPVPLAQTLAIAAEAFMNNAG